MTATLTITVLYSCTLCGLRDVAVTVPARPSEEPVVDWMNTTILAIGKDHQRRSPTCPTRRLQDLKIPIGGAEWIGGPPVQ